MQQRKHVLVAGTFLVVLVGLGGAEAYVLRDKLQGALVGTQQPTLMATEEQPVLTMDGVHRDDGASVDALLAEHASFEVRPSTGQMFLAVLLPDETVEIRDLFTNDQYAGTIAWVESPEVKDEFLALKDALLPAFSPQLSGLVDTTIRTPGLPTRNVLSFRDPALNPNALSFIRVRNRLFELHSTPGMEELLENLVSEVTAR